MSFAEPRLLWLALLAPAAAAAAAFLWRQRLAADAAWAARGLWDRLLAAYRPRRIALSVAALTLAVLGTALALARPRWGESSEKVERRGVDVVFVLDSSLSMGAFDVTPSRLYVAKTLVRRMAEAMPGNRLALVQAEGAGVALTPLTTDGAVIDLLLDTVEPGSLPTPGTELAPDLDTALQLFGQGNEKHRVLVLLSDGEDHGGGLARVIQRCKDEGVVVHAFGIGTPDGGPVPVPGSPGEFKHDEDGKVVMSQLHEDVLEDFTRATGGLYQRALSAAADPAPVVARIEAMQKRSIESESINTLEERFQWPLGLAAVALLFYLGVAPFAPAAAAPAAAEESAPRPARKRAA
ncbi:MAG TPA: VWA domain-containing protein [Thermoanaerobaculia bacterium]|nr:VWA domain-containing protein [Thermoanaerobaculia bacterium]